jgi:cytochrome c peroxidase
MYRAILFTSLFVISHVALGSEIDSRLQNYIRDFQLKTLTKPTIKNKSLFILGKELFNSNLLSGNNNISCADCHQLGNNTVDSLPLALGEGAIGQSTLRKQSDARIIPRNTPALFNLNDVNVLFWDGRVQFDPTTGQIITPVKEISGSHPSRSDVASVISNALSAQSLFPMITHEEMRGEKGSNPIANAKTEVEAWDLIVSKLLKDKKIKAMIEAAFPTAQINIGHIGEALAEFQKNAFFFSDTPYDDYLSGNLNALSEIQKKGMDVFFNKGKCGECHNGAHLSNFEFHSIGVAQIGPGKENGDDFGRYQWDQRPENLYAFRVPPLRNVALSAPYMHDGAFKTLAQIVEHYDVAKDALPDYKLVNNWKNYVEQIADADHSNDALRIQSISKKMATPLGFEPNEEKALTEFLTTALTDKSFLGREIEGDYRTYFRMQLRESGYEKLSAAYNGEKHEEIFYYFDLLAEQSFALRALSQPIRLILVKKPGETQLVYRQQAYKTATSNSGIVMEGNFNRQELKTVEPTLFDSIESSYLDMFNRMYTYNDGQHSEELPMTELNIIQHDVDSMNSDFHKLNFEGLDVVSDQMNINKDDLYFVPTSYNSKFVNLFNLNVSGRIVEVNLQKSVLRTETGSLETTWAIELETEKISKAEYPAFAKELLSKLGHLEASDVGGGSPSPSNLTLKVLGQIIK